ncbi:MAG: hypothetical protein JWM85_3534 [Acidimicrobiaceae bacterium]|nr:hypothetical protein [Acidimicrobiaceae bacterium]
MCSRTRVTFLQAALLIVLLPRPETSLRDRDLAGGAPPVATRRVAEVLCRLAG